MRKMSSMIVIGCVLVMSGCAPMRIKTYAGPEKLSQEVAVVKCAPFVVIHAVDGDISMQCTTGSGSSSQQCGFTLLPGNHTFSVCILENERYSTVKCVNDLPVTVAAQAGHFYWITYEKQRFGKWSWRAWVEDNTEEEKARAEKQK